MKSEYIDFLNKEKTTHQILVFNMGGSIGIVYHRVGFAKRYYGTKQKNIREKPCMGVWNVTYKDPVTLETIK